MSKRRSKLTRILHEKNKREKKILAARRVGVIPGETPEQELARKKRDLFGWVDYETEKKQPEENENG